MRKIPEVLKIKEKIDSLNGTEFDYRFFAEFKYGSVSISALCQRGYIKVVRKSDNHDGRPFNVYKATGNAYVNSVRSKKYKQVQHEEVLIFGKYHLSEMPKNSVTVHRLGI